jgi:hypothetical protein
VIEVIIIWACFFRNTIIIKKNTIMNSVPYTERRNALTSNIDTETTEGR